MSDGSAQIIQVPEHVVFRHFDGETVVLNLQTGQYHGLNPTAGRMFEALGEHRAIAPAADAVAASYGVPAAALADDLSTLVGQLSERGLVLVADDSPAAQPG